LNLYPELRRITDNSGMVPTTSAMDDPEPSSTMTFYGTAESYVVHDPDADGDEGRAPHYYGTVQRYDGGDNPPQDDSGSLNKKKYSFETENDSIGVYKSEEDSTSVNLTTEQLPRERVQVFFDPTSSTNNIIMQMFEVNSKTSKLLKLDVIHYGEFSDPAGSSSLRPTKNLFFAGKILVNSIGLPTFINLFTIILD